MALTPSGSKCEWCGRARFDGNTKPCSERRATRNAALPPAPPQTTPASLSYAERGYWNVLGPPSSRAGDEPG